MNYWITTHWPHSIEDDKEHPHSGVYIQDGHLEVVRDMNPGDLVFIYESKSGRTEKRRFADGITKNIPCHMGKEGVVAIVKVLTNVYEYEDSESTEYTNGSRIWWRYHAETENISSHGFVARNTLNHVLGYSDGYNLRGFGDQHSGIKKIDESLSNELIRLFNDNFDDEVKKLLKSQSGIPRGGFGSTSGGEGELHKRIKESIAKNPSLILNEPGLKTSKPKTLL